MTAQHWRTIRRKLIESGVHDPMGLPTMHILLDTTEALILESMQGGDSAEEDKRQRQEFLSALYKPDVSTTSSEPGKPAGWREPPPGFDDDSVEDSFNAFHKATG